MNLVFIRRNHAFNDMVKKYASEYVGFKTYVTISEYCNADIFININQFELSEISDMQWRFIDSLDVNEIILKDRLLRNIELLEAKTLVFKTIKWFMEFFSSHQFEKLVTYPIDNYVTDIMVQVARSFEIEVYGISNFFIHGYKRITVYGEYNHVREISDEEVQRVYVQLQNQFKSYMAVSFKKALSNSVLSYLKYKLKYIIFYILYYKILHKVEYDYPSTPYSAKINSIKKFFSFAFFTNSLDNFDNIEKSIYVPMHYHPEATIEYWSDDLKNVDYVSSLIKYVKHFSQLGWSVFLKEHPAMCFKQDIDIYKQLTSIPNVYILNPFIETSKIMEKFENFLIWTGSTGIEALVNDKTVFFASSNYYYQRKDLQELYDVVKFSNENEKLMFLKRILSNVVQWQVK